MMLTTSMLLGLLAVPAAPDEGPPRPPPPRPADVERAKGLYQAGAAAYAKGQYLVAIDAFDAALLVVRRPTVVFSLAQAERLQYFVDGTPARLERAVDLYREYLRSQPQGARRDHAGQHLATLVPLLERVRLDADTQAGPVPPRLIVSSTTPGARAQVGAQEPQPVPASFELSPGPVTVVVSAPGHDDATRALALKPGTSVAVNVELTPHPGRLVVARGPLSTVTVDGAVVDDGVQRLAPGRHRVRVTGHSRATHDETVTVNSDELVEVNAAQPVNAQTWLGLITAGLGGAVALGAGVPLGVVAAAELEAASLERTATEVRALTVDESAHHGDLEVRRDTAARAAVVMVAVGAAAMVAGALLVALDFPVGGGGEAEGEVE